MSKNKKSLLFRGEGHQVGHERYRNNIVLFTPKGKKDNINHPYLIESFGSDGAARGFISNGEKWTPKRVPFGELSLFTPEYGSINTSILGVSCSLSMKMPPFRRYTRGISPRHVALKPISYNKVVSALRQKDQRFPNGPIPSAYYHLFNPQYDDMDEAIDMVSDGFAFSRAISKRMSIGNYSFSKSLLLVFDNLLIGKVVDESNKVIQLAPDCQAFQDEIRELGGTLS